MADYCKAWGPDLSDVAGFCRPGEVTVILCEGCGLAHWIDSEGYRVERSDDPGGYARVPVRTDDGRTV